MRDDLRLFNTSLIVAGVKRPLRPLLDSSASIYLFLSFCLVLLPYIITVQEVPGDIAVKLADGQPQRVPRQEVVCCTRLTIFKAIVFFM